MEDCSIDLFLLEAVTARPFGFLVGEGPFVPIDGTRFLRQSECIYFCNHRKYFYNCLLGPIRKFKFSLNKNEYI